MMGNIQKVMSPLGPLFSSVPSPPAPLLAEPLPPPAEQPATSARPATAATAVRIFRFKVNSSSLRKPFLARDCNPAFLTCQGLVPSRPRLRPRRSLVHCTPPDHPAERPGQRVGGRKVNPIGRKSPR